jgi:hypothetical protein
METVQAPLPLHAPLQPAKTEFAMGTAVRVTLALMLYDSEQSAPQSIPAGLLETIPVPVPALLTDKVNDLRVKLAVTSLIASMVTEQVPVPLQAPLQPVNIESEEGEAVRVTTVFTS